MIEKRGKDRSSNAYPFFLKVGSGLSVCLQELYKSGVLTYNHLSLEVIRGTYSDQACFINIPFERYIYIIHMRTFVNVHKANKKILLSDFFLYSSVYMDRSQSPVNNQLCLCSWFTGHLTMATKIHKRQWESKRIKWGLKGWRAPPNLSLFLFVFFLIQHIFTKYESSSWVIEINKSQLVKVHISESKIRNLH